MPPIKHERANEPGEEALENGRKLAIKRKYRPASKPLVPRYAGYEDDPELAGVEEHGPQIPTRGVRKITTRPSVFSRK